MKTWTKTKPKLTHECLLITALAWSIDQIDYSIFEIKRVELDDKWYWGIFQDGNEWGDYSDLNADKYLIMEI